MLRAPGHRAAARRPIPGTEVVDFGSRLPRHSALRSGQRCQYRPDRRVQSRRSANAFGTEGRPSGNGVGAPRRSCRLSMANAAFVALASNSGDRTCHRYVGGPTTAARMRVAHIRCAAARRIGRKTRSIRHASRPLASRRHLRRRTPSTAAMPGAQGCDGRARRAGYHTPVLRQLQTRRTKSSVAEQRWQTHLDGTPAGHSSPRR